MRFHSQHFTSRPLVTASIPTHLSHIHSHLINRVCTTALLVVLGCCEFFCLTSFYGASPPDSTFFFTGKTQEARDATSALSSRADPTHFAPRLGWGESLFCLATQFHTPSTAGLLHLLRIIQLASPCSLPIPPRNRCRRLSSRDQQIPRARLRSWHPGRQNQGGWIAIRTSYCYLTVESPARKSGGLLPGECHTGRSSCFLQQLSLSARGFSS